MNKDNAKDYLPLVQALAEGRVIQFNTFIDIGNREWRDCNEIEPNRYKASDYRIKPEPREMWFNRGVNGQDRGDYTSREVAELYARIGDTQVCYREVIE